MDVEIVSQALLAVVEHLGRLLLEDPDGSSVIAWSPRCEAVDVRGAAEPPCLRDLMNRLADDLEKFV
jgi:hypothetical protein